MTIQRKSREAWTWSIAPDPMDQNRYILNIMLRYEPYDNYEAAYRALEKLKKQYLSRKPRNK